VDPIIQFPTNSQSLNPYSYILNNPLSGTDPTGYACEAMTGSNICDVDTGAINGITSNTTRATGSDGNTIEVEERLHSGGARSFSISINGADLGQIVKGAISSAKEGVDQIGKSVESVAPALGGALQRGEFGSVQSNVDGLGLAVASPFVNMYNGSGVPVIGGALGQDWYAPPVQYEGDQLIGGAIGEVGPLFLLRGRTAPGRFPTFAARFLPHGFASVEEFKLFGTRLNAGLAEAGYADARALLQGSAVTGRSFRTGAAFDAGRVSDFDVAIGSPTLLARARELGVGLRSGGTRTGPLNAAQVQRLGLGPLQQSLSREAGRPVNFMIYGDAAAAAKRAPSVPIP
jgi:hypothetical protein